MKQNATSLLSDDSDNNAAEIPLDGVEFDLGDDDLDTLPLRANQGDAKGQKDAPITVIGGDDELGATDLVEENDGDDARHKVGRLIRMRVVDM